MFDKFLVFLNSTKNMQKYLKTYFSFDLKVYFIDDDLMHLAYKYRG